MSNSTRFFQASGRSTGRPPILTGLREPWRGRRDVQPLNYEEVSVSRICWAGPRQGVPV